MKSFQISFLLDFFHRQRRGAFAWVRYAAILAVVPSSGVGQEPEALATLKLQFEAKSTEIGAERDRRIADGFGKYRALLENSLKQAQAAGSLEAAKRITEELQRLEGNAIDIADLEKHDVPEDSNLRKELRKVVDGALRPYYEQQATLIQQYLRPLETLKKKFVTQGDIAGAEKVNEEILRVSVELARLTGSLRRGARGGKLPINLEKGLVARFSFSANEGSQAKDESGNGYNATIQGATWVENGKLGGAVSFDGVDDQIILGKVLPDSAALTISVYVFYQGQGGQGAIFTDYTFDGGNDLFFSLTSAGGVYIRADKNGAKLGTNLIFESDMIEGWNHLVWSMGIVESIVYLNGKETARIRQKGSNVGHHGATIGYAHDGVSYTNFKGMMDEVMIWSRALDAREVKDLYDLSQ